MLKIRCNLSKAIAIATCFAVTTMFSGCDDKEKQPDIKVENQASLTQSAYADQTGGASGVTIITAGAWSSTITEGSVKSTKSGAATWLSISPSSGAAAGTYTITISLEPNLTGSERAATITIRCGDTEINIVVTQRTTKEDGEPYVKAPTLATAEATNVTATTATAGGSITDAGTPAYTERGVVYGTTANPTVANTKVAVAGSGTGNFSAELTNLMPETTYYVRAYATNENGTAYGNQVEFTTETEATTFAGSGTSVDPYQIGTAAQLAKLAEWVNAGTEPYATAGVYYKLTADINLGIAPYNVGAGWTPIGTGSPPFRGYFDGNKFKVFGLYIDDSSLLVAGLFGRIVGGSVQNLGVEGEISGGEYVGGFAGNVWNSNFTNCYAAVTVSGSDYVGGLVGYTAGINISNCYTTGAVSGSGKVGGVVGRLNKDDNVTNCYAAGTVSGGYAGGVVGDNYGYVTNCAALNPRVYYFAGGFCGRVVGYNDFNDMISDNIAWEGMEDNNGIMSAGFRNGANISATQAKTQTTYTELGWKFGNNDENPWKMGVGGYALPVFYWQTAAPAQMPTHLQ